MYGLWWEGKVTHPPSVGENVHLLYHALLIEIRN